MQFGTGGLRGIMGPGPAHINLHTIGTAAQGVAGITTGSVVIAYDSRKHSREFALESAAVLSGNNIHTYIFESLRPTPELSFAVRYLQATAGIVITASHNPPQYNGFKVYDREGCQILPHTAAQITEAMQTPIQRKTPQIQWLGREIDDAYLSAVLQHTPSRAHSKSHLRIVYTPLHGAGSLLVQEALRRSGFTHVTVVKEQAQPDPHFSTVRSPNPEDPEAFHIASQYAGDIILATDPDCDRVGVGVRDSYGRTVLLSGNEVGAILAEYLLPQRKGSIVTTVVSGYLPRAIASYYGITTVETLTGFKYIGQKVGELGDQFLFGYEESCGYLAGSYVRDKDGVAASLLVAEAAAYYKEQGLSLLDVLQNLQQQHGPYVETLHTIHSTEPLVDQWRIAPPPLPIARVIDYLPQENALKYILEDGSWICMRPSGTEPKIKIYASSSSKKKLDELLLCVDKHTIL